MVSGDGNRGPTQAEEDFSETFPMMELYINDYLMNLNRAKCNGQIGFMGADNEAAFKNIRVWQSN